MMRNIETTIVILFGLVVIMTAPAMAQDDQDNQGGGAQVEGEVPSPPDTMDAQQSGTQVEGEVPSPPDTMDAQQQCPEQGEECATTEMVACANDMNAHCWDSERNTCQCNDGFVWRDYTNKCVIGEAYEALVENERTRRELGGIEGRVSALEQVDVVTAENFEVYKAEVLEHERDQDDEIAVNAANIGSVADTVGNLIEEHNAAVRIVNRHSRVLEDMIPQVDANSAELKRRARGIFAINVAPALHMGRRISYARSENADDLVPLRSSARFFLSLDVRAGAEDLNGVGGVFIGGAGIGPSLSLTAGETGIGWAGYMLGGGSFEIADKREYRVRLAPVGGVLFEAAGQEGRINVSDSFNVVGGLDLSFEGRRGNMVPNWFARMLVGGGEATTAYETEDTYCLMVQAGLSLGPRAEEHAAPAAVPSI